MNAKTGFVFYFDCYHTLTSLPPEQRGWLITALCVYAERVWRDGTVTAQEIAQQFPQLSQQAQVAYQFMTNAIWRDTQRWLQQRQARIQRRTQQQAAAAASQPSQEEQARRFREEAQRLRQLMREG